MLKCLERDTKKGTNLYTRKVFLIGIVLLLLLEGGAYAFSSPPNEDGSKQKAPVVMAMPVTRTDWPTFHGDAAHTGLSNEQFIRPPLSAKWSFSTGGNVWSSPAIVGPYCYVGSSDGKLYAIDIRTGETSWEVKTGDAIYSSPSYYAGKVYVGSLDRRIYAVDALTGTVKWMIETGEPITSSPCVDEGVLYIGSWDGNLYAIDAEKGVITWKYQTGGPIYSSPAVYQEFVYIGSSDGKVYALNKVKGTVAWVFETKDYVSSSPSISDKILYIGSWDKTLYALNYNTGSLIWKFVAEEGIYTTPAVSGDLVVFGTYGGKLYAANKKRGYIQWVYTSEKSAYHSSPVIANDVVYVGLSYKNKIQAFDLKTGEYLWSQVMGASVGASPAVSKTMLFIAASDGRVYAFGDNQAPTAKAKVDEQWQKKTNFTVSWSGLDEGGSQIESYDVQYKEGSGGEWMNWLSNVTVTSAVFGPSSPKMVKDGTTYYFQARARDHAGNVGAYAGGEGDAFTAVDLTPPSIVKVEVDKNIVRQESFISPNPSIYAVLNDNVGINPKNVGIIIDNKTYLPDSFEKGELKFKLKDDLAPGYHTIKIVARDLAGNDARAWEVSRLRVSVGIEASNIKVAPNPFNPLAGPTYVYYSLNADAAISFFVYDQFGSLIFVKKFTEGTTGGKKGYNRIEWIGLSSSNAFVQNGEYSYKLIANNRDLVGKGVITVQK